MEHEERQRLAEDLCSRFVAEYGADVLLCGLYGSTARGSDTAWSDLEMLFITRDGCAASGQHLVFRGMPVSYMVMTAGKLEQVLSNPSIESDCGWPFFMGVLNVLKVLHGQDSLLEGWLRLGKSVPEETFRASLERQLPGLILESYGRIFSCKERGNDDDWYCAVLEVLFEIRDALCLLNRSWATHDYLQGLKDTFAFPRLPRRYRDLVPLLWHVREIDDARRMATELVEDFWELLDEEGIELRQYEDVSAIPL